MQRTPEARFRESAPPFGGASVVSWIRRLRWPPLVYTTIDALQRWRRGMLAIADPGDRVTALHFPSESRSSSDKEIVVLCANLWHDWPLRRRLAERMESFAKMIEAEGVDIVLTQEVVRTSELCVDRWLSERLGMSCLYSRANGHQAAIGFEEGLAIFARFPLVSTRVRRLEPQLSRFVTRLALGAEIVTPFGKLWAFSVHLGLLQSHNALQVGVLQDWVAAVAGKQSAVIGGDFNAPEHAPQIQRTSQNWLDAFRHVNPEADGTTHELRWPWGAALRRHRLDYLFLRENEPIWRVVDARHIAGDGSDHRPILVRLSRCEEASHRPSLRPGAQGSRVPPG